MTAYYAGGLPQGASIITELEPRHYYTIGASRISCFPFKMRRYYSQLVIDAADTTPFESCFVPVIRCWASRVAAGQSLTQMPNSNLTTINIGPDGCLWNFWIPQEIDRSDLQEAFVNAPIERDETYWFNVQNLQNKSASFFLRFTFHGNGITHVE